MLKLDERNIMGLVAPGCEPLGGCNHSFTLPELDVGVTDRPLPAIAKVCLDMGEAAQIMRPIERTMSSSDQEVVPDEPAGGHRPRVLGLLFLVAKEELHNGCRVGQPN
jgi:hypothetical protein